LNNLVPITLYGWIPVTVILFAIFPPRRAVLISFIGAWLFLPMAQYDLPLIPNYGKMTATCVGTLLGAVIFDSARVFSFRPRWLDLPVVIWCLAPFGASVVNGLGAFDGLSAALTQTIAWGLPYLIGRLYFTDLAAARELALALLIGGLIYVPFCLYEIRFSPQLHRIVYGYHQHSFLQQFRLGGYRPMVFMQHGLMVGMWMTTACLSGLWLRLSGAVPRLWGINLWWFLVLLLATTVFCRSTGALAILLIGVMMLLSIQWMRTSIVVMALLIAPPAYMIMQMTSPWGGEPLVTIINQTIGSSRGHSLGYRLWKEQYFVQHALKQPILGWGGWGRMNPPNPHKASRGPLKIDGMWYVALGTTGLVGLAGFTGTILLPAAMLAYRARPRRWASPQLAGAGALAVILMLYMIDNLLNAMINPIYMLAAGGLITMVSPLPSAQRAVAAVRRRTIRNAPPRQPVGHTSYRVDGLSA
jgi:hypothetical protein